MILLLLLRNISVIRMLFLILITWVPWLQVLKFLKNIMLFSNISKDLINLFIVSKLYGFLVLLVVVKLIWLRNFVLSNINLILLSLIVILIVGVLVIMVKNVYYLMNFVEHQFHGKNFLRLQINMLLHLNKKDLLSLMHGFQILLYLHV